MLNLPLALRIEKNKLVSTAPWVLLVDLTLPTKPGEIVAEHICICKNTDDVTFKGYVYTAFSFDVGESRSGMDGKVPSVSLTVANQNSILTPLVEQYGGMVGFPVTVHVVHTDNLSSDYSDLSLNYVVQAASLSDTSITFTMGAENPMRRRFPLYSALPKSCGWIFKGAECNYGGHVTACDRTLTACKELGNTGRFGGRPGLMGAAKFR